MLLIYIVKTGNRLGYGAFVNADVTQGTLLGIIVGVPTSIPMDSKLPPFVFFHLLKSASTNNGTYIDATDDAYKGKCNIAFANFHYNVYMPFGASSTIGSKRDKDSYNLESNASFDMTIPNRILVKSTRTITAGKEVLIEYNFRSKAISRYIFSIPVTSQEEVEHYSMQPMINHRSFSYTRNDLLNPILELTLSDSEIAKEIIMRSQLFERNGKRNEIVFNSFKSPFYAYNVSRHFPVGLIGVQDMLSKASKWLHDNSINTMLLVYRSLDMELSKQYDPGMRKR